MTSYYKLRIRFWLDECIVYNATTGETHLLEKNYGDILQAIYDGPIAKSECYKLFADKFDYESIYELKLEVESFLLRCRQLNLLELEENAIT